MKIGMLTWGSHGDIRPFLALADGLQEAGHDVHLVVTCLDNVAYSDISSEKGARITVLTPLVLSPEQAETIGQTAYNTRNPMTQMATILRLCFAPAEDAMFRAAQDLCADAELLIGHYFMHPLQIAAEHAGLPYVSVLLSHAAVPSEFSHPLGIPLGRIGNRFLWRLTRFALNRTIKHYPDRLRRQLGLPLTRDIVSEVWLSRYLTLVAVSPQICRRQADWPASTQVCGFLNMPNGELDGALPESLAAFLAAGEAPIYMTYGSWMPGDLPGQTRALQMLTQAARLANCRAIIQCPSWEACGLSSSDQILYVSIAPHQKIFPHCFAVLHHGGAGTTQTATLAGKPSIVVANISEQEHWGHELHRLGIASKPNRRRSVSAASLASQIRTLRTTPGMAEKARATADAMRHENGVAEAVKWIGQKCREREAVSQ